LSTLTTRLANGLDRIAQRPGALALLLACTTACSAFLLFLVQPIIAKQILPWFGGSAAVWTTCMVFFQTILLAGYAYADYLIQHVPSRRQAIIHTGVALCSLLILPITAGEWLKPNDAFNPFGKILFLLVLTIGLPYFLLSTTGPLIQAWAARFQENADSKVYRLYAVSNLFSMIALISYPFVIEPLSNARWQSLAWSLLYAGFVASIVLCAWLATRQGPGHPSLIDTQADTLSALGDNAQGPRNSSLTHSTGTRDWLRAAPKASEQLLWLAASALGSVLLLSITNHLTQNVASIPFLWVLPLSIYLASFILTFDGKGWYQRAWFVPLACLLVALMMGGLRYRLGSDLLPETGILHLSQAVPLYLVGLFVLCMVCHGELVARKPSAKFLTRFYLMVSLGGALGGVVVALVAPLVFNSYYELPLALLLLAFLLLVLLPGIHKLWPGLALCCAAALGGAYYLHVHEDAITLDRNFYGTLKVTTTGPDTSESATWRLMHGVILHGEQYRHPKFSNLATTYYGESSGIGRAIFLNRETLGARTQHIGLIGMGVGTLATYGRPGDRFDFYELNPQVLDFANSHFSYLKNSKATVNTILGDARLSLERVATNSAFDVLAVDAFSSDSIPVHLLTREAMALYLRHMHRDGVIAFHITNRYLDLNGVVKQLADSIGWRAFRVSDERPEDHYLYRSDWILVTQNPALIQTLSTRRDVVEVPAATGLKPWTDQYNNLFQVLKR
jgi:hypothetical protein